MLYSYINRVLYRYKKNVTFDITNWMWQEWEIFQVRERPSNLKGGGGYVFFLKKYSDSQCCWKKYSDFGGGKKKNVTLVLSGKKFLNETKNHNPPPPFKLNGRSLMKYLPEILVYSDNDWFSKREITYNDWFCRIWW